MKLGVLAWMTLFPAGIFPVGLRLVDDLGQVVADNLGEARGMDGNHIRTVRCVKMLLIASTRLAWPPNTEAPSVKELVVAITGSL